MTSFAPACIRTSRFSETIHVVASDMGRINVPGSMRARSASLWTIRLPSRGDGYTNVPAHDRDQPALLHDEVLPTRTVWPLLASERTLATAWFWFPSSTSTFMNSPVAERVRR